MESSQIDLQNSIQESIFSKAHSSFQQLINLADNHFSNATNKLGASVEELDEVLGDLADTLARIPQNGNR